MELKYYRLIKTIAEEGSIANSSERLFLTQSALSHQLRDLEERLGFKVFHRKRNKWILTAEGEELYALANTLFSAIEQGFGNIQQIKEGAKGHIKIAVECQSFFHSLPAFIQKMAIIYPEIDIELNIGTRHELLSQVQADEIDIAISTHTVDSNELYSLEIGQDEVFAIVNKEHFFNTKDIVDPTLFSNAHLIINSFPLEGVAVYEYSLRPNQITPKKISAIPFTEIALAITAANLGVMCAPKWQLDCFKIQDNLTFKRIGLHGLKRKHYLVLKRENLMKKYIGNFISTFEDEYIPLLKDKI